ncbi:NB-ARC domain-containing protein [Umezawaea sp. Da 62-37]|uniref:ATP-binding protein n=1 Tax=Umezawaea sp. Da 62-37 TaxID=3075927 RepID=UPI0028F71ECC|nr:NB-ARC domain-containing protein [Umezawaea sp. Da 62-37]WNV86083.1 NB-ARC domain-containing protein [Umezawaea sp. Da 62-37]
MPGAPPSDEPLFGDLLRFFRLRGAWTQEQLSTRTGVSVRAIADMERGRARAPQRRTAELLAAGLELSEAEADGLLSARRTSRNRAAEQGEAPCALPEAITDLAGRAPELARLTEVGDEQQLVVAVVHGAPGIGKSTLAVHAAHRMAGRFPGGRFFLDLRGMDDEPLPPADAAHLLLRAMGVATDSIPADGEHRLARYRSLLATRKVLLLLDNSATEAQVRPLLAHSPGSVVLVTSRNTLAGLDAVVRVEPGLLDRQQAVDLLSAIAGAERVAADLPAARRVAELCDGVPLAVRIAGNRLAGMPASPMGALVTELADERRRLSALAVGDVQVRAAFATSYRHLRAESAELFRRLAVIPGTDTGADLAAVAADQPVEVAERALEDLLDASLLRAGTSPDRYGCHDLLRVFAAELLTREEGAAEAERKRATTGKWLLDKAVEAALGFRPEQPATPGEQFPDQGAAADWLAVETANWRGALRAAVLAGRHRLVLDVATAMHWYSDSRGDAELWLEVFTAGEAAATALGSVRDQAVQLNFLCWTVATLFGDPVRGKELSLRAAKAAKAAGDLVEQGWAEVYRGAVERMFGDLPEAVRRVESACALFHRAAYGTGEALARSFLGELLHKAGRFEEAVAAQRQEIARYRVTMADDGQNLGVMLTRLAEGLLALGELDETMAVVDEAERLFDDSRAATSLTYVRYLRGVVLTRRGDLAAARECLTGALVGIPHPSDEVDVLAALGDVDEAVGDRESAHDHRAKALELAERFDVQSMRERADRIRSAMDAAVAPAGARSTP